MSASQTSLLPSPPHAEAAESLHARTRVPAKRPSTTRRPLPSDLLNLHEIVAKARQNLNQNDWDYIVGGVEIRDHAAAEPHGARRDRLPPAGAARREQGRRLGESSSGASCGCRSCSHRSARWKAFTPPAPTSVVRGAGEFGAGHMLSSVCDPGLEDLAEAAPDALRLYQLYVRGDEAWVDDHVARAIAHGYAASRSPSTPPITAGASATSPSAS